MRFVQKSLRNSSKFVTFIVTYVCLIILPVSQCLPTTTTTTRTAASSLDSSWEFGVALADQIVFFDRNWTEVGTAGHRQFKSLSAIVYDEVRDQILVGDLDNNVTNIYAIKLATVTDDDYSVQTLISQQQSPHQESNHGLVFDPVEGDLYWINTLEKCIYKQKMTTAGQDEVVIEPKVLFKFTGDVAPQNIALDVCRRKLYWTTLSSNGTITIERGSLVGTKQEVLITENFYHVPAIAIDQYDERLYWIEDESGTPFKIESADLQGADRKIIFESMFDIPKSMIITKDQILWADRTEDTIMGIEKQRSAGKAKKIEMAKIPAHPRGLVYRKNLVKNHQEDPMCKLAVKIMTKTTTVTPPRKSETVKVNPLLQSPAMTRVCLNGGTADPINDICHCRSGFSGANCETQLCHNYCIHGECFISSTGYPQCHCTVGFTGERCETNVCAGFCLNDGQCSLEQGEPVCQCLEMHAGRHCEFVRSQEELCKAFCETGETFPDVHWELQETCRCPESNLTRMGLTKDEHEALASSCNGDGGQQSDLKYKLIFATIFTSLVLVLIIVVVVVKCYKPARPKIRKTFVVRKNVTPLTYRPTTEQCEITIEDCCNMNICDTPCFDPNLLQRELDQPKKSKSGSSCKEDKKELLNNIMGENGDLF